jgi:hypothetical protein
VSLNRDNSIAIKREPTIFSILFRKVVGFGLIITLRFSYAVMRKWRKGVMLIDILNKKLICLDKFKLNLQKISKTAYV